MTDSRATDAEPDGAPRIAVLDILRGIAILGILFMNINDMGASLHASFEDVRHIGWRAIDQAAWWTRAIVAEGTARALLEMLFGAGIVILTGRFADRLGAGVTRRFYTRQGVLLMFGLGHLGLLLWPGDILHSYALAAMIAFPLRALPARRLVAIGLSLAAVQLVGGGLHYVQLSQRHATLVAAQGRLAQGLPIDRAQREALIGVRADERAQTVTAQAIAREDAARTAGAGDWVRYQWWITLDLQRRGIEAGAVLEALATMLLGAGLFKYGILQGERSPGWYARTAVIAYAVGVALRVIEAGDELAGPSLPRLSLATGEIGRLAMTVGHVALVNRLLSAPAGARLLRPFVAAGRTALSLYIAQTLIFLWLVFPPWGLALYGRFGWAGLMALALIADAALLVLANWWLRRFRIAPVEWGWRSLVEWRRLPFRRDPAPA